MGVLHKYLLPPYLPLDSVTVGTYGRPEEESSKISQLLSLLSEQRVGCGWAGGRLD